MEYTMNKHEMLKGALVYDLIYNYQASAIRAKDKVILDEMYTRYPGLVLSPEEQDALLEDTIDQLDEEKKEGLEFVDLEDKEADLECLINTLCDEAMDRLRELNYGVNERVEGYLIDGNYWDSQELLDFYAEWLARETGSITRTDLYDIIVDILTDYSDNFVGEPCTEIIDEVLSHLEDSGITHSQAVEQIEEIVHNMFD